MLTGRLLPEILASSAAHVCRTGEDSAQLATGSTAGGWVRDAGKRHLETRNGQSVLYPLTLGDQDLGPIHASKEALGAYRVGAIFEVGEPKQPDKLVA